MKLEKLRRQIDAIDKEIVDTLNRRARLSLEIGSVKKKHRLSTYSPERESDVYRKVCSRNKGPLADKTVQAIYREIMSGTLNLESPLKIAYLGPAATFTHLASIKKFGSSVEYVPLNSISEIFLAVEKGRADYGVVPIENSIEGAVTHTLDMFVESDLKICSEVSLEIVHNLLGRGGTIQKVYSHPNVFGQCRIWLEANLPGADLIEVSSTTRAAEIATKERGSACIASVLAAECYGLKILARSIQDYSHNTTRFLVVGETEPKPTRNDKTSIMFSIKDRIGALHDMPVPFKANHINLTKIESRPSKRRAWDYYFFVDLVGHHEEPSVKKALRELERQAAVLKVLGSYPMEN